MENNNREDLVKNEVKNEEELELNEPKTMKFQDEEGNVIEFEIVAVIYLDENEYRVLAPLGEEDKESGDEYIYKVIRDEDGNMKEFVVIEDDAEFIKVKKEYSKLLYDEK